MRLLILLGLLLLCKNTNGQNPDSLAVVNIFDGILLDIEAGDTSDIDTRIRKGLEIFEKQDDFYNWLYWLRRIGRKWRAEKENEKAVQSFQMALDRSWRKAKIEKELDETARIHGDLGWTFRKRFGDQNSAKEHYEKAKTLFVDSLGKAGSYIAEYIYNPLINIYYALRDEKKTTYYFNLAKQICIEEPDWDLFGKISRNFSGNFHELGKDELALEVLLEALDWQGNMSEDERIKLYHEIGLQYFHLKDLQNAKKHTALAEKQIGDSLTQFDDKKIRSFRYKNAYIYGRIFRAEKRFLQSTSSYLAALEILKEHPDIGDKRQFPIMHFNLGHVYADWQRFDTAGYYYQKGIEYLSPVLVQYKDPFSVPEQDLFYEDLLAYAYQRLGNISVAGYQAEGKRNTDLLERAIGYYGLAHKINMLQVESLPSEESRLAVLATHRDLKEDLQFALYELFQVTRRQDLKEKMLAYSENSRAFLLLNDNMNRATGWTGEDQEALNALKRKRRKRREAQYQLSIAGKGDHIAKINELEGALIGIDDELNALRKKKDLSSRFTTNRTKPLQEIQETLNDDQALVEFFVGERHIYIYLISNDDFKIYRKDRPEEYEVAVTGLRNHLTGEEFSNTKSFANHAFTLYRLLLQDALEELPAEIDRLVIVRDHFLHLIPFETLVMEPFKENQYYHELSLLLNRYSISNPGSASLYCIQQAVKSGRARKIFAGYVPRYDEKEIVEKDTTQSALLAMLVRSGQYNLPGAFKEVVAISDLLDGDRFIGDEANKLHFKTHASNYRVLHLSMHGLANEEQPHFSELLFTPGDSGKREENILYPIDLYDMNLKADFVVLSACQTGLGKIFPGEGVFNFSRAFTAAGVPSTVMSLWNANDGATSEIMDSLFNHLKVKMPKDKALRQAKLDYINRYKKKGREKIHPSMWSAFLLCGNVEPLDLSTESKWRMITLSVLALFLLTILFFRKRS